MKHRIIASIDQREIARRTIAGEKREAMRSGVVHRAQTFRARKGAGSYRRKAKYPINGG